MHIRSALITSLTVFAFLGCESTGSLLDTKTKQGLDRQFYTATICSDGKAWRWATASTDPSSAAPRRGR